ncbi:hypothetical protein NDU88_006913 [Pleurodeles waltl]|uniref:Uncharacterized protein n=1 Tax=Pleurodeles waltl TaxID=8319 RepID=A0AAV7NS56_PLEWA|nr:hypothetical protein NDU88_006913 [Pleurodeles waltl]
MVDGLYSFQYRPTLGWGNDEPPDSTTAIPINLRAGVHSIDAKFDSMDVCFDQSAECMHRLMPRIKRAEWQISDLEDDGMAVKGKVVKLKKQVLDIAMKNRDLEAHSRSNNIWLVGIAESANTGSMATYIETLLTSLFD